MHACLLHIYNRALLYLSCLLFILEDRSWLCARAIFVQVKTDLSSRLRHPFGYVLFYTLKLPNGF
jgi:hypothetical protein